MYLEYFNFSEPPFSIAPDPRYLFMSERHREALAHLIYGIQSDGGFVLLTGEIGTGKTTVCRCLLEQIPDQTEIALVLNPKVTAPELLAGICDELHIEYPQGNTSIKVFVDCINAFLFSAHALGKKVVLIIDEAQTLSADVLEQVRLLTNLETNSRKLLQIIMLGQPELRQMLERPELRQLSQRITARYHLDPLSVQEVGTYIHHRLQIAGVRRTLFSAACIQKIYRLSQGVPRLINILCDRTLLAAYVRGRQDASPALVEEAAREVFGTADAQSPGKGSYLWYGPLAALCLLFALVLLTPGNFRDLLQASPPPALPERLPVQPPPRVEPAEEAPKSFSNPAMASAFSALLDLWGAPKLPLDENNACTQAATLGFQCLIREGGLGSLRMMNRPAVLKLSEENGLTTWAALVRLDSQKATLASGNETLILPIAELVMKWRGEYTLLWQPPQGYLRPVNPGEYGPTVSWADQALARLSGKTPLGAVSLGGLLLEEVKAFQQSQGITPDGILGPLTLIHLDSRVGTTGPRLLDQPKG